MALPAGFEVTFPPEDTGNRRMTADKRRLSPLNIVAFCLLVVAAILCGISFFSPYWIRLSLAWYELRVIGVYSLILNPAPAWIGLLGSCDTTMRCQPTVSYNQYNTGMVVTCRCCCYYYYWSGGRNWGSIKSRWFKDRPCMGKTLRMPIRGADLSRTFRWVNPTVSWYVSFGVECVWKGEKPHPLEKCFIMWLWMVQLLADFREVQFWFQLIAQLVERPPGLPMCSQKECPTKFETRWLQEIYFSKELTDNYCALGLLFESITCNNNTRVF